MLINCNQLLHLFYVFCSLPILLTFANPVHTNVLDWAKSENKYSSWLKASNDPANSAAMGSVKSGAKFTFFVPIDSSVSPDMDNSWFESHLVYRALDAPDLLKVGSILTMDQNRPKLQFSRGFNSTTGETSIYVLNARIIESHKVGASYVHVVDQVIKLPILKSTVAPKGIEYINYPNQYEPSYLRNMDFSGKINETDLQSKFSDCSGCTFFVPENIQNVRSSLNGDALLGHVVDDYILFSRSMNTSQEYKTKAASGLLTVTLSKHTRIGPNNEEITYIQALSKGTMTGIILGSTRAKVIHPDIPVLDGVVHIIEKPLVVTDISISEYLKEEGQASISEFFNIIKSHENLRRIYQLADPTRPFTVFAFSNEAYKAVAGEFDAIKSNASYFEDLLKLHFVDGAAITSYKAEEIKNRTSLAADKKLSFTLAGDRLYVEGEGVKAACISQDIIATNGVIHIINKVLGIPSSSIKEKLREDPQLRDTYITANKSGPHWLDLLGNLERNFTLFAPSNAAWQKLKITNPSAYKQLVEEGEYKENARNILNRHLVLDRAIPLEALKLLTEVRTSSSNLHVANVTSSGTAGVVLRFMQDEALITRADIKSTNGLIHEIDNVLMQEVDLFVSDELARSNSFSTYRLNFPLIMILFSIITIKLSYAF